MVIAQYSDTRYLLNTGAVAILMSTEQISIVTWLDLTNGYHRGSVGPCSEEYSQQLSQARANHMQACRWKLSQAR